MHGGFSLLLGGFSLRLGSYETNISLPIWLEHSYYFSSELFSRFFFQVRDVEEALQIHKNISPVCKEFCAAHGMWDHKHDSADPFTWDAMAIPEPAFDVTNGYAGSYDPYYNATATALTMTTTLPPAGDCRLEVECALYEAGTVCT